MGSAGAGAARWLDEGGHAVEESDEVRRREDLKFGSHYFSPQQR